MKRYPVRFQMKALILQKEVTWFEYIYEEGIYCSLCKTAGLQLEQVHWISKPLTYWRMTELYHPAGITKTLLDINITLTNP